MVTVFLKENGAVAGLRFGLAHGIPLKAAACSLVLLVFGLDAPLPLTNTHQITVANSAVAVVTASNSSAGRHSRRPAEGPLRILASNPRYFTDGSGKAIYLAGSHTWANMLDVGES